MSIIYPNGHVYTMDLVYKTFKGNTLVFKLGRWIYRKWMVTDIVPTKGIDMPAFFNHSNLTIPTVIQMKNYMLTVF